MTKPTIYTVATAHLDTSWHWTLERTIEEYIPKTLEENFSLFEKYPDYTFSFEGAYRYALMEEYYPELFERLKEYIAQGRWRVAGSAWENGDVNIPSPEALLRNFLLGNGYFKEKFGQQSCDVYLPDCFGFGRALPGVAAHVNLKGFTTQKLMWGSAGKVPFALGRWQGPDGGEIFACPDAHNYTASLKQVRGNFCMKRALAMQKRRGLPPMALILHGVGDMGGAPKESSVQTVCNELAENDACAVQALSAGSDQIFRDIAALPAEQRKRFPLYTGEWLLTDHGTGCYTSRTFSKRWNRRAEQLAFAAESACAWAGFLGRVDYPRESLNQAWRRVIAHQFHDDMTGTSEEISYKRNWDDLMAAQQRFAGCYADGVSAIVNTMNTAFAAGRCAAIVNPTQWERREAVELRLPHPLKGSCLRALDAAGKELPVQLLPDGQTAVLAASLPPMGVALYDIQLCAQPCAEGYGLSVTERSLENDYLRVRIDKNGDIRSLYDKRCRREMLRGPVRLAMFNFDGSPVWPAWELYEPELKRLPAYARRPAIEVLENGPARGAIAVTRSMRGSAFRQVISLDALSDFVRVHCEIDWHSPRSLLKIEIPCAAANKNATYDLGFGVAERPTNTRRQYEVPAQQWADVTDKSGRFGLTVLSDSKTGWDKPDDHTLRLTAVYSPRCGDRGSARVLDFGRTQFDFGLFPHVGGWQNGAVRAGMCFGQRPAAFWPAQHNKSGPNALRFGKIDGPMVLRALKQAEESDEWVLRVQESDGLPMTDGIIELGGGITEFREIYGSEEARVPPNRAALRDGALRLTLNPFEIRSFALRVAPMGEAPPVELAEVKLPKRKETLPGDLSLPGDEPILRCRSQVISLPAGKEARLCVASFDGDREAVFKIDSTAHTRMIYDAREPIGAGDLYYLGESGYVKPAMPAREFGHIIDAQGKAMVGATARFYTVTLPMHSAAALTLPDDDSIVLLGASVCGEASADPACALFDRMEPIEIAPVPDAAMREKMPVRRLRWGLRTVWNYFRVRVGVDFGV